MKGGSDIKKVKLKFIGTGIGSCYQASVIIYDKSGNIVFQGKTYNGKLTLYLKNNSAYRLVALLYGKLVKNVFYVNNSNEKYIFYFKQNKPPYFRTITFFLKDANYDNLPIMKGEMVLWKK